MSEAAVLVQETETEMYNFIRIRRFKSNICAWRLAELCTSLQEDFLYRSGKILELRQQPHETLTCPISLSIFP